jgi:hypothetical protein
MEATMAATENGSGARGKRPRYWCFLVRCRLEEGAGPEGELNGSRAPAWRFNVQQIGRDPSRRSFACLHDLAAHIEAELAAFGPFAEDSPNRRTP